jgi:hypothetical protein
VINWVIVKLFKLGERDINRLFITSELEEFLVLLLFIFCLFIALSIIALNNLDERSLLWLLCWTGPIKSCYLAKVACFKIFLPNPRIVKGDHQLIRVCLLV